MFFSESGWPEALAIIVFSISVSMCTASEKKDYERTQQVRLCLEAAMKMEKLVCEVSK